MGLASKNHYADEDRQEFSTQSVRTYFKQKILGCDPMFFDLIALIMFGDSRYETASGV
jgi:hypothetical protein